MDTRIFRRECVSLVKAGFRVSLVCVHDREEIIEGVHIIPLPKPVNKLNRRILLTRQAAGKALELSADLYHFHDPELIPAMKGLARKSKSPVIWDAHEDFVTSIEYYNQFFLPAASRIGSRLFSRMELKACLKEFAGVITVSEPIADRYRKAGIPTCLVENYVDLDALPYPPACERSDVPLFSSTGAQTRERLVPEIAQAFGQVRQEFPCELAFWGQFSSDELRDEIQKTVLQGQTEEKDLQISNQIPWKTLMQEKIPTAWLSCVLMNLSNRNNQVGLPNRCFENWANGVPILATEGSEVARITRESEAGLVVKENSPSEIASAFRIIARDRDRVEAMGAAARKAIETRFNWDVAFGRLLEFYARFGIHAPADYNTSRMESPAVVSQTEENSPVSPGN